MLENILSSTVAKFIILLRGNVNLGCCFWNYQYKDYEHAVLQKTEPHRVSVSKPFEFFAVIANTHRFSMNNLIATFAQLKRLIWYWSTDFTGFTMNFSFSPNLMGFFWPHHPKSSKSQRKRFFNLCSFGTKSLVIINLSNAGLIHNLIILQSALDS